MDRQRIPDQWSIPDELWEAIAPLLPEHVNPHPPQLFGSVFRSTLHPFARRVLLQLA